MQLLHYHKKGAHLNTVERYYIYAEYTANNHFNDNHTLLPHVICDTLPNNHGLYPPTCQVPHTVNTLYSNTDTQPHQK